ncbi:MAG: hypothetical protein DMG10_03535 [Acidobacteria bacterium]|nr:MAG: hypothetical protein DMG10_03535 [Acidobacteriota bacterium]
MRNRLSMLLLMAFVFVQGLCLRASAQTNDYDDSAPVQVGFVVITPPAGFAGELIVFETFGLNQGGTQIYQAGIIPGDLTTEAMIFVNKSSRLSRDVGFALVNPGAVQAKVTMILWDANGIFVGTKIIFVPLRNQVARFVSELFSGVSVPDEFTGTLTLESDSPVGLTVLRRRGPSFSTMPITNLSPSKEIPVILVQTGWDPIDHSYEPFVQLNLFCHVNPSGRRLHTGAAGRQRRQSLLDTYAFQPGVCLSHESVQ